MQIIRTFFHFFCIFLHEHLHISLFFRTFVPDLLNILLRKVSGPFPIRSRSVSGPFLIRFRCVFDTISEPYRRITGT